MEDYHLQEG